MPPLNRFPSSPSPRGSSKQVAGELTLSPSMSRPNPSSYRASIRRFSSRRPHPSIATVADLFVGSLVLAGFCHEHSPRCRNLPGLSSKLPGSQLRTYRRDSVADGDHHSAPKPWSYSGSWPRVQSSQHRPQLGPGAAQAENERVVQQIPTKDLKEAAVKDEDEQGALTSSESPEQKKELLTIWHQYFDPKIPNQHPDPDNSATLVPNEQPKPREEPLSYDERRYLSTASLYKKILGEEYDWKEAVKLVLPHPHPPKFAAEQNDYDIESPSVAELIEAVHSKPRHAPQYLFSLYRNIPSPGVEKLPPRTRGALLRQLSNPPNRRPVDLRRYLALVNDMISCDIPMSRSLWTTAIAFSCRHWGKGRTKKKSVVRAIGLWQQMEHHAKIEADEVVFNILFDSAVKAGQFSIAERLEKEMIKREISPTRFFLIPKLNYHAERRDPEGISRTFDQFVQSGNLVDTVILNGLLSAFLKAGDTDTAEGVYERMLMAHNTRKDNGSQADITGDSLSTRFEIYRSTTKHLGRLLKLSDSLKDPLPGHYRAFQESLPLGPDTRTFHIMLRYYAITTGRFDKVLHVIRDMENTFEVPPRHMIYSTLFEGFSIHGKTKKQTWTQTRLWSLWNSYLWALIDSKKGQDRSTSKVFNLRKEQAFRATWVNPFKDDMDAMDTEARIADEELTMAQEAIKSTSSLNKTEAMENLYTPLPSEDPKTGLGADEESQFQETSIESHAQSESTSQSGSDGTAMIKTQELSMEEYERSEYLLNSKYVENDIQDPVAELNPRLESHLENGVFVGRSTILHILRAFGACTQPEDVIEAWDQLQQLWDPFHQNAVDVAIIRDELERQLEKYRV